MASFSLTTGKGGFVADASGKSCGPLWGRAPGSGAASWDIQVTVVLAAKVNSTGRTAIVAHGTFAAFVDTQIVNGSCSPWPRAKAASCFVYAGAEIHAAAVIEDTSNRTFFQPSNSWPGLFDKPATFYTCSYGSCGVTSTGRTGNATLAYSPAWFFNVTGMSRTHHYVLAITISGYAIAGTATSKADLSGSLGAISVRFDPPSYGAAITSITEN